MTEDYSNDGFPPPQPDPEDQGNAWTCMHRNIVAAWAAKRSGDAAFCEALDRTTAQDMSLELLRNPKIGVLQMQGRLYTRLSDDPRESPLKIEPADLAPAINGLSDDCRQAIAAMLVWMRVDAEYSTRFQNDGNDVLSIESVVLLPDEEAEEGEDDDDDGDEDEEDEHDDAGAYGGGSDWWKPDGDGEERSAWQEAPDEPETARDRYDEHMLALVLDTLPDLRGRYERMLQKIARTDDFQWPIEE